MISAPKRNVGRAFQTDAAMNYGNSGGPVVGLDGSFLGIASFVGHTYPHWGLNSGIGFATRADAILEVLPVMLKGENFEEHRLPFLGVRARRSPDESFHGATVYDVIDGSAADMAGLKAEDIIVELGEVKVEDFSHLRHLISRQKPGDTVSMKVQRQDSVIDLKVTLGARKQ